MKYCIQKTVFLFLEIFLNFCFFLDWTCQSTCTVWKEA